MDPSPVTSEQDSDGSSRDILRAGGADVLRSVRAHGPGGHKVGPVREHIGSELTSVGRATISIYIVTGDGVRGRANYEGRALLTAKRAPKKPSDGVT